MTRKVDIDNVERFDARLPVTKWLNVQQIVGLLNNGDVNGAMKLLQEHRQEFADIMGAGNHWLNDPSNAIGTVPPIVIPPPVSDLIQPDTAVDNLTEGQYGKVPLYKTLRVNSAPNIWNAIQLSEAGRASVEVTGSAWVFYGVGPAPGVLYADKAVAGAGTAGTFVCAKDEWLSWKWTSEGTASREARPQLLGPDTTIPQ